MQNIMKRYTLFFYFFGMTLITNTSLSIYAAAVDDHPLRTPNVSPSNSPEVSPIHTYHSSDEAQKSPPRLSLRKRAAMEVIDENIDQPTSASSLIGSALREEQRRKQQRNDEIEQNKILMEDATKVCCCPCYCCCYIPIHWIFSCLFQDD